MAYLKLWKYFYTKFSSPFEFGYSQSYNIALLLHVTLSIFEIRWCSHTSMGHNVNALKGLESKNTNKK